MRPGRMIFMMFCAFCGFIFFWALMMGFLAMTRGVLFVSPSRWSPYFRDVDTGAIASTWAGGTHVSVALVVLTAIVCGTVVLLFLIAALFRSVRARENRRTLSDDEGNVLEQIWDGLQKMEDRVMNLETILLDRRREREYERPF